MSYDMKQSGERIRRLRTRTGYTQEKMAEKLDIDRSFYSRIEAGKSGCSIDLLVELSIQFDVSLDYLIIGRHNANPLREQEKQLLKGEIEMLMSLLEQMKKNI